MRIVCRFCGIAGAVYLAALGLEPDVFVNTVVPRIDARLGDGLVREAVDGEGLVRRIDTANEFGDRCGRLPEGFECIDIELDDDVGLGAADEIGAASQGHGFGTFDIDLEDFAGLDIAQLLVERADLAFNFCAAFHDGAERSEHVVLEGVELELAVGFACADWVK